jgi:hypothetical protein
MRCWWWAVPGRPELLQYHAPVASRELAYFSGAGPAAERARNPVREDRARRAARSQVLPRPLGDYTGTFESPAVGRMVWRVEGGALRLQWGVLEPGVEVFHAAAHQIRVQFPGGGEVLAFAFAGAGPATAIRYRGYTFDRR